MSCNTASIGGGSVYTREVVHYNCLQQHMNRQAVSTHTESVVSQLASTLVCLAFVRITVNQVSCCPLRQLWSGLDLYHYNTSSAGSISYTVAPELYLGYTLTVDRLAELDILTTIDFCYH